MNILIQVLISVAIALLVVLVYHVLNRRKINNLNKRCNDIQTTLTELLNDLDPQLKMKATPKQIASMSNPGITKVSSSSTQKKAEQRRKDSKKDRKKGLYKESHEAERSSLYSEQSQREEIPVNVSESEETQVRAPQNETICLTSHTDAAKTDGVRYTYLVISDGKLVVAEMGQASYYRSWEHKGRIFFEFYCDEQKMRKAINNRSAIIEPCCKKDDTSVDPNIANMIKTLQYGELDSSNNIINKVTIKYI